MQIKSTRRVDSLHLMATMGLGGRGAQLLLRLSLVVAVVVLVVYAVIPACGRAPVSRLVAKPSTDPAAHQVKDLFVVAHEDDDLLFMNPDVLNSIGAGHSVRTIYLTAGDAGATSTYWKEGREVGVRHAYALMAAADDRWTAHTDDVVGKPVVRYTLDAWPEVSLIFLRLPDGFDGGGFAAPATDPIDCGRPSHTSLQRLWLDTTGSYRLPVLGSWSKCNQGETLTRAELQAVLVALLQDYAPVSLHIQDPGRVYGVDHSDHIYGAKLVFDAHLAYGGEHELIVHRGYNSYRSSENLSPDVKAEKELIFCAYAEHDPHIGISLCADYGRRPTGSWIGSEFDSAQISNAQGRLVGPNGECLTAAGGDGGVIVAGCSGLGSQQWLVAHNRVRLADSNQCLQLGPGADGGANAIGLGDCSEAMAQRWTLTSDGLLRVLDGRCLELPDGGSLQTLECTALVVGNSWSIAPTAE
jgi:LmbE family N-acetylglucosaminyl deacetylase